MSPLACWKTHRRLPECVSSSRAASTISRSDLDPDETGFHAQAGDLRRLLGLYEGWHRRVFPCTTFDGFLEDLEKLGATAACKARQPWHQPSTLNPIPASGPRRTMQPAAPVLRADRWLLASMSKTRSPPASLVPAQRLANKCRLTSEAKPLLLGSLCGRLLPQAQMRELRQSVVKIAEVPGDDAPPPMEVQAVLGPLDTAAEGFELRVRQETCMPLSPMGTLNCHRCSGRGPGS